MAAVSVLRLMCCLTWCAWGVQDEMRGGMTYVSTVIFDMVPVFHRRIDTALANLGQVSQMRVAPVGRGELQAATYSSCSMQCNTLAGSLLCQLMPTIDLT